MWLLMFALSVCIQKSSAMPKPSPSIQPVKATEKEIDEYIYSMEKTIEHLLRHLSFQISVLKIQARESSQELTHRELWKKNCALLKKKIKDILPAASKKMCPILSPILIRSIETTKLWSTH